MLPTRQGSFRLFRIAGIDVFLHWSWFVIAVIEIQNRASAYSDKVWNAVEYLSLFAIVLLHELGHALACRQVGGQANQIVLWPLGGVAYVLPPPRPGATLWSIAAGPLVNVALLPVTLGLYTLGLQLGWRTDHPDLVRFLYNIAGINMGLLCFNLLPVYPLDGGQIVQSLLWFVLGRGRSLMVASVLGLVGVAVLVGLAFLFYVSGSRTNGMWLGILSVFIALNCWRGFQHARVLARLEAAPRRAGIGCPVCGAPPPAGPLWMCHRCRTRFDPFETNAVCPGCHEQFGVTGCLECGALRPIHEWFRAPASAPSPPPFSS